MSNDLFSLISKRVLEIDPNFPWVSNVRWIKRHSEDDANVMTHSKSETQKLSSLHAATFIEYKDQKFLCVSGFDDPSIHIPGLIQVDSTPALFHLHVLNAELMPNATLARIREIIFAWDDVISQNNQRKNGEPECTGHDLTEIESLFPKIKYFKLDCNEIYLQSKDRALGAYIAASYTYGPLQFSEDTRKELVNFFVIGPDHAPYKLILMGALSFYWKGFFLELYRSIENLYSIPRIEKLSKNFVGGGSLYSISRILIDHLDWRPKENESLNIILADVDKDICAEIFSLIRKNSIQTEDLNNHGQIAGNAIYKLRNAIVHFRPDQDNTADEVSDWDRICCLMLKIIFQLYSLKGGAFYENRLTVTS